MNDNLKRRCETCLFWWRRDEEMLPEDDKKKISGVCKNEHMMVFNANRLPHHGAECDGWIAQ